MKRLAVLAFLLLAGCGSLGATQPHTLSLAFKPGDTYKYHFHSTTKQTATTSGMTIPVSIETTADEAVKVESITASGNAQLGITLSKLTVKLSMGGVTNTTTDAGGSTIEVELARDGRLVSVGGSPIAASSPLLALTSIGSGLFVAAILPDHAVKPGDTWTKDYDQTTPTDGAIHIATRSTYLRDESVNGVSSAVVETTSNGTLAVDTSRSSAQHGGMPGISIKGTFETDVTTWIDPNGHRILKSHSTAKDDATVSLPPSPTPPAASSPAPSPPPFAGSFAGPITLIGTATTDLNPA